MRETGERGSGAPVTVQRLTSPATPWMWIDDWLFGDRPEPAALQATLSTQLLRNGCRNATFTMAAEWSEAGSFTGGAAAVPWEYGRSGAV
jgi:hypothetical protein